jgi:hypothetical protein
LGVIFLIGNSCCIGVACGMIVGPGFRPRRRG